MTDALQPVPRRSKIPQLAPVVTGDPTSPDHWDLPFIFQLTPPSADGEDPGTSQIVSIGLIDFLQRWTMIKKVAMCVKVAERNKATIPPKSYGERFIARFGAKFIEDESVQELSGMAPAISGGTTNGGDTTAAGTAGVVGADAEPTGMSEAETAQEPDRSVGLVAEVIGADDVQVEVQ